MEERLKLQRYVLLALTLFEVFLFALAMMWLLSEQGFEQAITAGGLFLGIVATLTRFEKTVESAIELTQSHRDADLRLLKVLWNYISSNHVHNVVESVNQRNLLHDYYSDTFGAYIYARESEENHFIDPQLEKAFNEFDELMHKFVYQLSIEETVERIGGRYIFVPAYKRPEVLPNAGGQSSEIYHRNLNEHEKTKQYGLDLWKQHDQLIKTIKAVLPAFDFPASSIKVS